MRCSSTLLFLVLTSLLRADALSDARDRQDVALLQKQVADLSAKFAKSPQDASAAYRTAAANGFLAEVLMEKREKKPSASAAEAGIEAARKAVEISPNTSEYHRILGSLCGQIIPANVLAGLKYGRCALDEITKAIELDPKAAVNYLSRGVGNYYLPPSFGGGVELALKDFDKALAIDAKLADAYLWKGIALRKLNRNADAHQALEKALALNPNRIWTKEQLEKTPSK